MKKHAQSCFPWFTLLCIFSILATGVSGDDGTTTPQQSLQDLRVAGAENSRYRKQVSRPVVAGVSKANLQIFHEEIRPLLQKSCVRCHGKEIQEADFRIDTLNPDLLHGGDVAWWIEIMDVISNGEMPPEDAPPIADDERSKIVDFLASELQLASQVRRSEAGHSSFRRLTRYEYNYALQDLLGLPFDFAKDLPPEPVSEDGFQNSSEVLRMSAMQFDYYRSLGRSALNRATIPTALLDKRPEPIYWSILFDKALSKMQSNYETEVKKKRERFEDDPTKLANELARFEASFKLNVKNTHYKNLQTDAAFKSSWSYRSARYAWDPTPETPDTPVVSKTVAVIPSQKNLIVELGNQIPDAGTLRIRVRAGRTDSDDTHSDDTDSDDDDKPAPALRWEFGWQASNNSSASQRITSQDVAIDASADDPQFYEWNIALSEISNRNPLRRTAKMGRTPNPSEYLKMYNTAMSPGNIQIDYIEITAPQYNQWPPSSHARIFFDSPNITNETAYAREVLTRFTARAWRRQPTDAEIDQKMSLLAALRSQCENFQEAMIEVLASVISSPHFLYVAIGRGDTAETANITEYELATRLSMFLWCSLPDEELLELAESGTLSDQDVLAQQTERMLGDGRAERFSKHFVRQWLGMQLLDFLNVDKKAYPQFDRDLKEAMQQEPIALFDEVLQNNRSIMDFLHADYAMVNERLARHYSLEDVYGSQFRKVRLQPNTLRGGLLTQAGLLAMNSDGKDSHPLKRGIWLLESLLNDPPPPPPPAVPEIDLADPEIAKMTLKERMEDHRNDPACMSCHAKIDPWGIAFENFDAIGSFRTKINGTPVDASSMLFNKQELDGVDGLKRFLLNNRQDQFARAMVHKLTTYALGRPMTFSDRAELDKITSQVRNQDDRLATLVRLIVTSEIFRSK